MLWDIQPDKKGRKRNLFFSFLLGAIIMIFLLTVFPTLQINLQQPKMSQQDLERMVEIIKAREQEIPEPEEEPMPEMEEEQEIARRRTQDLRERQTRERRDREEIERTETATLEQDVDLTLQRQRDRLTPRADRQRSERRDVERTESQIVVARPDRDMELGEGDRNQPRALPGRSSRDRSGLSTDRNRRGSSDFSLNAGVGELSLSTEPGETSGDIGDDVRPILEWIKSHQQDIPSDLMAPEYFNYRPGDYTSEVSYNAEDGTNYTIYLLGRDSDPPEIKMFFINNGEGILLTDIGAAGEQTESFQAGRVRQHDNRLTLQMSQINPGDPRAKRMFDVFLDWWNSLQ